MLGQSAGGRQAPPPSACRTICHTFSCIGEVSVFDALNQETSRLLTGKSGEEITTERGRGDCLIVPSAEGPCGL